MKAQLSKWWSALRTSFWFIPSLMAVVAGAMALAAVELDEFLLARGMLGPWTYTGGAQGASAVLQTIAGSMITIAGVVFSLTLVALSLASSQFGPRLLRNFMRDTSNQVVLGTFVSTFLYCLLVLRTIRRDGEGSFVPQLSVTLGVLLALISLWVLIYFIHHISTSIQADQIIVRVAKELLSGIDRLFPEQIGKGPPQGEADQGSRHAQLASGHESFSLRAHRDGYLQLLASDTLMLLAIREDVVIMLRCRPGDYIVRDSVLAEVRTHSHCDDDFRHQLRMSFALGEQRTPDQDLRFAIHQLVEIAVRALSPGINDPFTAIACIDRLGSALSQLAKREMTSPYRFDDQGRLRIIVPPTRFPEIVDAAFDDIRRYAGDSPSVLERLMEIIAVIADSVSRQEDRDALRRHADKVNQATVRAMAEEEDQLPALERYQKTLRALMEPVELTS